MEFTFKFNGKEYVLTGEEASFQYSQFLYLLEQKDYNTVQNRIQNQLLHNVSLGRNWKLSINENNNDKERYR